jgi:hypothetical protein
MFVSPDLTPLDFGLWCWVKSEYSERNVDTRGGLLTRIWDAAARIKNREDQLRRTTHDPRTRFAKCTAVGGGIFEN